MLHLLDFLSNRPRPETREHAEPPGSSSVPQFGQNAFAAKNCDLRRGSTATSPPSSGNTPPLRPVAPSHHARLEQSDRGLTGRSNAGCAAEKACPGDGMDNRGKHLPQQLKWHAAHPGAGWRSVPHRLPSNHQWPTLIHLVDSVLESLQQHIRPIRKSLLPGQTPSGHVREVKTVNPPVQLRQTIGHGLHERGLRVNSCPMGQEQRSRRMDGTRTDQVNRHPTFNALQQPRSWQEFSLRELLRTLWDQRQERQNDGQSTHRWKTAQGHKPAPQWLLRNRGPEVPADRC